jgi:NAD(P)-dependent dehydrogenase (short-subunit alcohol dehydrogenase family)
MGNQSRVVIVTGASQGIGKGLVSGFRVRGHHVVANSRSIKPGNDPDVLMVPGDIAGPETAEWVVAAAVERFGRVDTLVNNAGIFIAKPFVDYTEAVLSENSIRRGGFAS